MKNKQINHKNKIMLKRYNIFNENSFISFVKEEKLEACQNLN